MGKIGGTSWLTAVKRAFRSPTKDSDTKSSRRKLEQRHEQDDEKKTQRRRWLFRKHSSQPSETEDVVVVVGLQPETQVLPTEQRQALAVAEAAVATAKAAVEIIRLRHPPTNAGSFKQHSAARVIQTAFRGYLSRKALMALKGIVKLQALIRGQNVRKQANMTMRCMQALLRVQARVRDQRARLSQDGERRSMLADTSSNLWESKYLKDIRDRKSKLTSRDSSHSIADDWSRCPRTLAELDAILKTRNESALAHNKLLGYDRMPCEGGEYHEVGNRESRLDLDGWLAVKQSDSRASTDLKRDSVKTVEIDSYRISTGRKSRCQSPIHRQSTVTGVSPHRRSVGRTPPPPPSRPASPRLIKEEKCYSTANTPSLRSNHQRVNCSSASMVPNYMAATESARARLRSQSAPRQRPSTPERDRGGGGGGVSAKKRLSYPVLEPTCAQHVLNHDLSSPSFKSAQSSYVGKDEHSSYSCYTDSVGGGISPCSTADLRRWLR